MDAAAGKVVSQVEGCTPICSTRGKGSGRNRPRVGQRRGGSITGPVISKTEHSAARGVLGEPCPALSPAEHSEEEESIVSGTGPAPCTHHPPCITKKATLRQRYLTSPSCQTQTLLFIPEGGNIPFWPLLKASVGLRKE